MRTARVLLVLVVLLLVTGAAWFAFPRSSQRPPAAAAAEARPSDDVATNADAGAAPASGTPVAARATAPLPPPDAPFDTVVDDLLARAEAGEAGAACRLSLELLRCDQLRAMRGRAAAQAHRQALAAESSGDTRHAEYMVAEGDFLAAVETSCAAIDTRLIDRAPHFLRAAALAGDREALLQYIDGGNLFPSADYTYLDEPHFDLWRREAPRLLAQALADGEPQAAIWMAQGRGGSEGAIQGLLRDDVERAQAWVAVVDRLFDELTLVPVPVAPPSAAQRAAVAERAARWRSRWYGERSFTVFDRPVLELLPGMNPNAVHVGRGCGRPRIGTTGASGEVAR